VPLKTLPLPLLLFVCRRPNDPQTSCCQQSHLLSIAFVLATFMSSLVHRRTLSIHAVLLLPGKYVPSISSSIVARTTLLLLIFQWQYLESFRCLICSKMPFSSGIPIFSWIHVLVFSSVQLILSIQCHTHISKAVTSFSSYFFSAELSDPYNAVLHISDRTTLCS